MSRPGSLIAVALLVACSGPGDLIDAGVDPGSDAATADAGPFVCTVVAPTSCTDPDLRYSDVEPIVEDKCQPCHDGTQQQWPLTTYNHLADWFDLVPPEVANCRMPPEPLQRSISDEERVILLTWFACGFPQ